MKNIKTTSTPVGKISSIANDWYTVELEKNGQYAEQINIDGILSPIIKSASFVLDIGAHVGYHSIAYAKMNEQLKVIAFEPQKNIYSLLVHNIENNGYKDRISTMNVCVGHKIINTTLSPLLERPELGQNIYNMGGAHLGFGDIPINMITVDSLNLPKVDYMKIDVEGSEHLVVYGAENTIKKFKPVIHFEDLNTLDTTFIKSIGAENIPNIYDLLKSYGYVNFQHIPYSNVLATT